MCNRGVQAWPAWEDGKLSILVGTGRRDEMCSVFLPCLRHICPIPTTVILRSLRLSAGSERNRGISPPCFVVCQRRPGGPFQAVRPAFPEVCVCGLGESARTRNLGGGVVLACGLVWGAGDLVARGLGLSC